MAGGPGVSVQALGDGRWRVRWRETLREDGATRRVQRERVVRDEATAIDLRAQVLRAVETGRVYEEPDAVREVERVASLDSVLRGWLRARAARGLAQNTIEGYAGSVTRILKVFRELDGIAESEVIPGTVLARERVIEITNKLRRDGLAEGTLYATVRVLVAAWTWACDDPAQYPGLTSAPRDLESLLPRTPVYTAAPPPTMAECDAVIRRVAAMPKAKHVALPVAVIARCTGLRLGRVLAIKAGDVHLATATLTVTTGKSRREKVEQRTVPIAPFLAAYLAPMVARAESPEATLLRRRSDLGVGRKEGATTRNRGGPDRTLRTAWDAAEAAGEVRKEVWKPKALKIGRPDHAFRAAFQAHLVTAGVRDEVIDALVGHAGGLRERHYVDPGARMEAMRAAVALIPPVDWAVEGEGAQIIALDRRR